MNFEAIQHRPFLPEVQPVARNRVIFHLLSARDDLTACELFYWKRSDVYPELRKLSQMTIRYQDEQSTQWVTDIKFAENAHYIKYFFRLTDIQGNVLFLNEQGFSGEIPLFGHFELLQVAQCDVLTLPEWSKGIIYYQIFPERFAVGKPDKRLRDYVKWETKPCRENYFGGDLLGICNKLPYLQQLCVECIYMNPVFHGDFNHKYATIDYFHVDPDFGTDDDLCALVHQAHELGIRVLLDGVFNHVGVHFAPFEDLLQKGEASIYREWFYPQGFPLTMQPLNYECVGDYPYMPRLRTANPAVREMIAQVMLHWLEIAHIDGWRMDVADEVDASTWRYLRLRIKAEYPETLLLGETWGDGSRLICGGDQLDCVMNYLFRDAIVDYFAKECIDSHALDVRLQHMLMKYPNEVNLCMYNCLDSHDTARFLTEAGGSKANLKLALAFTILFIGSPALYYGDELGMTGGNDPDCRGAMAWEHGDQELHNWVEHLLHLRKQSKAIRLGNYKTLYLHPKLFAFERSYLDQRVLAVFNREDVSLGFTEGAETITVLPRSVKIIMN